MADAPLPTPAAALPTHPAFAYRARWRYLAAQFQWGLIFSGVLAGGINLALDLAFRYANAQANHLFTMVMPHGEQIVTWSPIGYLFSVVLLVLGVVWGVSWRVSFRRDFQRRFRL